MGGEDEGMMGCSDATRARALLLRRRLESSMLVAEAKMGKGARAGLDEMVRWSNGSVSWSVLSTHAAVSTPISTPPPTLPI